MSFFSCSNFPKAPVMRLLSSELVRWFTLCGLITMGCLAVANPRLAASLSAPFANGQACGGDWSIALRFDDLYDVTAGHGILVAVGASGTIQTSLDQGATWTRHYNDVSNRAWFEGVAWNGSLFVAVGNTIVTSPDGVTWTSRDTADAGYPLLRDILWTGTQFVAVGNTHDSAGNIALMLTSPDGVTWQRSDIGAVDYFVERIAWSGDRLVVTGNDYQTSTVILTSTDGVTWNHRSLNTLMVIENLVWGNDQFVAVGTNYEDNQYSILTSVDGATWMPRRSDGPAYGVTWDNNRFVATAYNRMLTSVDGVVWTSSNVNVYNTLSSVAWTGQQWVSVGVGGTILTSANARDWTRRDSAIVKGGLEGITSNGQQFVAVGFNGTLITSSTGLNWTPRDAGGLNGLFDVAWGNNQFVAVGYGQNVLTSPNGVTWTPHTLDGSSYYLKGIVWSGSQFAAIGYEYVNGGSAKGVVFTSPDGVAWTRRNVNAAGLLESVAWSGNRFIAVGHNEDQPPTPLLLTSADGVTWSFSSTTDFSELYDIVWGNHLFVAVGSNRSNSDFSILTSADGVTWTPRQSGGSVNGITWDGSQFVAVGYGAVLTSPDGIAWTRQDTVNAFLNEVAASDNQRVAVGSIILHSDCSGGDDPATTLITHYYVSILRREPDAGGLAYWQQEIADKQAQGLDVKPVFRDMAAFFFFSPEYLDRNTPDEEFITNLYLTFFQREPDNSGMSFWLNRLAMGVSRNSVMADFLYSPEFTHFMEGLGF